MPTSRDTRVTSDAKALSWSTIVLIVDLSSRISPLTSTVIFFERSPLATAVVTSAMLRTWLVRLAAIRFTLSVRSFHVPATSGTCAWPPSLPSVPTSRATRDTSEEKAPSWSTMVFTTRPMRRNSPRSGRPSISSSMVCERLPLATASMTRATSAVGRTRSPISVFTESIDSAQEPAAAATRTRWLIWPSLPTSSRMRANSSATSSFISTTSLKACAISPSMPVRSSGRRTLKSPLRSARSTPSSARRSMVSVSGTKVRSVMVIPPKLNP